MCYLIIRYFNYDDRSDPAAGRPACKIIKHLFQASPLYYYLSLPGNMYISPETPASAGPCVNVSDTVTFSVLNAICHMNRLAFSPAGLPGQGVMYYASK